MRPYATPASDHPSSAGSGGHRARRTPPSLAAAIVDIEERDGPRAAYAALQSRLAPLRLEGAPVPAELVRLETRLVAECCALSQGR